MLFYRHPDLSPEEVAELTGCTIRWVRIKLRNYTGSTRVEKRQHNDGNPNRFRARKRIPGDG